MKDSNFHSRRSDHQNLKILCSRVEPRLSEPMLIRTDLQYLSLFLTHTRARAKKSTKITNLIQLFLKMKYNSYMLMWNREGVVDIATGYGLDDRGVGVRVPVWSRIFSSPRRPDRLWCPPNFLSNGYQGLFPRG
jgi:hypothetical protein